MTLSESTAADAPLLKFAMIGFCSKVRQQIIDAVKTKPRSSVAWQESAFSAADCWLVCGEKTRLLPSAAGTQETTLRVSAGLPTEQARILVLSDVKRPLAFSVPMQNNEISPQLAFDPSSQKSVHDVLTQFHSYMKPTLGRFVLGKQLTKREADLRVAVYHVTHNGQLLAVLDFSTWRIGLLPNVDPDHLERAVWEKRPTQANAIPEHFLSTDLAELRWTYAQHASRDVLPARYQNELIYFRQSPRVPLSWLTDSHLLLLQELSIQPGTVQTLAKRCGIAPDQVRHDLAGLYFAVSLTTTPGKAAAKNTNRVKASGNLSDASDFYPSGDSAMPYHSETVSAQLR